MLRLAFAALTFAVLAPSLAVAQQADAPILKVGDTWTVNFPNFGGPTTRTVTAIAADGSVTVSDDGVYGRLIRHMTKEWNPLGGDDLDAHGLTVKATYTPAGCWYRFPLAIGKIWSCDYSYSSGDFTQTYHYSAKVVAYEKVRTKAGTFDAFRIETTANDASGTNWYAPKVRASVKFESASLSKYNSELMKYHLK